MNGCSINHFGDVPILFSPGIYEHCAALIGESPLAVSRDLHLLHRAHLAAWRLYTHPMVVAGIDVFNIEPEAMGAGVDSPGDNVVPCITSHPARSIGAISEMSAPDPAVSGRMPLVLEAASRLMLECSSFSTVFVPVCGPLALGNGLVGMDEMLCSMMDDPAGTLDALLHLAEIQKSYIRAILATGARPLIFESGASPPLLPPSLFSEIEAPALGRLFAICRESGDLQPACILGGDVEPVLELLLALRPGFLICPSETDQEGFVATASSHSQVEVRINMPVSTLGNSDWKSTAAIADRALALARRIKRGSVGTGVVPFNTTPEHLLRLRDYIQKAPENANT